MNRDLAIALVPTWWPIVVARYRRLTPAQRSILEAVAHRIWARHAPGEASPVEVNGAQIADSLGTNERYTQQCLTALLAPPGSVAVPELSPPLRGHGILRLARIPRPGRPRLVALAPWGEWWWETPEARRACERAVERAAHPEQPNPAERLARVLLDHLQGTGWATGREPVPTERGWPRWVELLGQLVDRGYTEDDLRAVLGYVEDLADPHWRDRLRGPRAAGRLINDWECLILRVRRAG